MEDDWKVSRNLTVNAGLRYEYTTPYYGAGTNNNINVNLQTGALVFPNGATDYLLNPDSTNWGTWVGFAWQALPN